MAAHERVLCERCDTVLLSCRCIEGGDNIVRRGVCPACSRGPSAEVQTAAERMHRVLVDLQGAGVPLPPRIAALLSPRGVLCPCGDEACPEHRYSDCTCCLRAQERELAAVEGMAEPGYPERNR